MSSTVKQLLVVALILALVVGAILALDWWETRKAIAEIPLYAFAGGQR